MSFLRFARPLTHLARSTPALARPFTSLRPCLTSGYGKSTGAGTQSGGQAAADPLAGGELSEYSGPSVAEKQKGGPVDQQAKGAELKARSQAPAAESDIEYKKNTKGTHPRTTPSQTTRGTKHPTEGHKDLTSRRTFSTDSRQRAVDDLKQDASRLKEQVKEDVASAGETLKHAAEKAKLAGKIAVVDAKEGGQLAWKSAKQTARAVVQDVKDAATGKRDFSSNATGTKAQEGQFAGAGAALDAMEGKQGDTGSRAPKRGKKSEDLADNLKSKLTRVSAAIGDVLAPMSADSEKLETSARRGTVRVGSILRGTGEEEQPSASAIGEVMQSVKKCFLEGPQEMPQGVGKRAKDDQGRPMETGTRGS